MEARQAGPNGYVLEDDPFEGLIMAVQTVAGGGSFVSPAIRARLRL
jgi:DNA-binding NarL/FixJ family response regulator